MPTIVPKVTDEVEPDSQGDLGSGLSGHGVRSTSASLPFSAAVGPDQNLSSNIR